MFNKSLISPFNVLQKGSPSAEKITSLLLHMVEEKGGLSTEQLGSKLVSTAADGASTMQGCHAGVITRLRDQCAPHLVQFHCYAHQVDLAFEAGLDNLLIKKITSLVHSVYKYFSSSPKR